jgi:hypothetical protein
MVDHYRLAKGLICRERICNVLVLWKLTRTYVVLASDRLDQLCRGFMDISKA